MTKQILVGGVPIGGGAPVPIQSMTNTPTQDVEATVQQIRRLSAAGCQIVRVAVPNMAAAKAVGAIKEQIDLPLVVDIHFNYKLALECIEAGADKVRINPGNIGDAERVKAVAHACARKNIPIRIGVNGGSLEKPLLEKYGGVTPQALVDSAFGHIALLNRYDFDDICVSLKSSSVPITMQAYQLMSQQSDYPLHLGVTEAGTTRMGTLKSAAGIGGLLALGIGDTIRVTLTADPVAEIAAAKDILAAAGLLALLAEKNLMLTEKMRHMARRTTREKLLSYLSAQALRAGSAEFDIPLDRQQLADFLAVDRSAMSAALGKLRDEGVLEFRKNHFRLLRREDD